MKKILCAALVLMCIFSAFSCSAPDMYEVDFDVQHGVMTAEVICRYSGKYTDCSYSIVGVQNAKLLETKGPEKGDDGIITKSFNFDLSKSKTNVIIIRFNTENNNEEESVSLCYQLLVENGYVVIKKLSNIA